MKYSEDDQSDIGGLGLIAEFRKKKTTAVYLNGYCLSSSLNRGDARFDLVRVSHVTALMLPSLRLKERRGRVIFMTLWFLLLSASEGQHEAEYSVFDQVWESIFFFVCLFVCLFPCQSFVVTDGFLFSIWCF